MQRHQADQLASLEAQLKNLSTKEAAKVEAEEGQPILLGSGMKMITGGPQNGVAPQPTGFYGSGGGGGIFG